MSTRPTLRAALAVAALLLVAGACSKTDSTSTSGTSTTAKTGTSTAGTTPAKTTKGTAPKGTVPAGDPVALAKSAKLVTPGTLTICSDIPYAPFEFPDDANGGKLTGFDVQLVDAMAKKLELKTDWKTTPFDSIIPALAAGNCDMIASATTIKPERAEKVNFSSPYFDADQSLLVLDSEKDTYATLDSLAGKTIGVQAGTTGADYAAAHKPAGATVKEYPGADDLFSALVAGDIQAVLQDYPVNKYRANQKKGQFAVTETFVTGEQYGFATAKDNAKLGEAVNAALVSVGDSGQYDQIYTTWFG